MAKDDGKRPHADDPRGPNWRVFKAEANVKAKTELDKMNLPKVPKEVSKKIKGDKDPRGKRRGSDEN